MGMIIYGVFANHVHTVVTLKILMSLVTPNYKESGFNLSVR